MWRDAIHVVFDRLKESGIEVANICCISVSGQQHGLVSLDAKGRLTRKRSKLWNDFSTIEECNLLTQAVGGDAEMIKEVGNSQRTGYTAAKIFHMYRHEKEAYGRSDTFFLVHNYINWYLTGGENNGIRVMEPGDTSGMALWNPVTSQWSQNVIDAIDPGLMKKLPLVKPSDKTIGNISKELVDKYGFSIACKIDAGSGDNMYGAIGTGNIKPGIVTISLGTSGTAYTVMDDFYTDPTGEIASFCDSTGQYLPLLCVSNMANGYDDILKIYDITHEQFEKIVEQTKAGNEGRLLIPWFVGERTPDIPQATPVFFGFQLGHFTKEILCRAILEGHVLNLYNGFQRMAVAPSEIRLTGGLSKSKAWCQCIADVFETEVVPVEGEGAALGAALHAAWVWSKEEGNPVDLDEIVAAFVKPDETRRVKPDKESTRVYQTQKKLYNVMCELYKDKKVENPFTIRNQLLNTIKN
jgi:xylulokinase